MCIKIQPNRSTDGRDDATFEGKKHKHKLKGRTLMISIHRNYIDATESFPLGGLLLKICPIPKPDIDCSSSKWTWYG